MPAQPARERAPAPCIAPGYTFTLAEHPRDGFNTSYLVMRVEHYGVEP